MTRDPTLAQELARHRIRVNSFAPGAIEIRAAVWLASDASDCMIGATLYVDGGMLLYPELLVTANGFDLHRPVLNTSISPMFRRGESR